MEGEVKELFDYIKRDYRNFKTNFTRNVQFDLHKNIYYQAEQIKDIHYKTELKDYRKKNYGVVFRKYLSSRNVLMQQFFVIFKIYILS